jgi:YgiT-type zinc finger domain-containing protein
MTMLSIKTCPTCGASRIKRIRRTLKRSFNGRTYTVPNVEFYACADCGENLFDTAATDKIQSHSPAFTKSASERKSRKAS